eukprot:362611-Chlamydomonas_euryale.AAC.5
MNLPLRAGGKAVTSMPLPTDTCARPYSGPHPQYNSTLSAGPEKGPRCEYKSQATVYSTVAIPVPLMQDAMTFVTSGQHPRQRWCSQSSIGRCIALAL